MKSRDLIEIYERLLKHLGKQYWWPAETEFEVIIGAILTQAAAWKNVEIAIENLKAENPNEPKGSLGPTRAKGSGSGILNPAGIKNTRQNQLKKLIKSAGYYNAKSRKLKEFVNFLYKNYGGDLNLLLNQPKNKLRKDLLSIWGIGPETADSIVLYAAHKPSFVVDAYTKRIFSRLGVIDNGIDYESLKKFFENNLPENLGIYKEFHALIVELGKKNCRTKPVCGGCPLGYSCRFNFKDERAL